MAGAILFAVTNQYLNGITIPVSAVFILTCCHAKYIVQVDGGYILHAGS